MMHTEVILDRQGDLPVPPGYLSIASEVDFLRHATDDAPLLIRGERLCAWAEAFYHLRGRPYRYQQSLNAALRQVFPTLNQLQTAELAQKIGANSVALEELSTVFILNHCYPDDYTLWQGTPSREHAARWLLWLFTHQPDDAQAVILQYFATEMERRAIDTPEARLYRAITHADARSMLWQWLGAADERPDDLGAFPVPIPESLLAEIKPDWTKRLIESKGAYFVQMLAFPMSIALRQSLAQLAAQFYEQNTPFLTRTVLCQLQPYLGTQMLSALEKHLPPPEPSPMPQEEAAVLDWFQAEYLPYRRWQADYGDEQARKRVCHYAQTFARWYLEFYPQWLLQPGWISFQQSAQLHKSDKSFVTLCVILDGLPAWDAEDFAGQVSAKIARLQLEQKSYCFAPLPTVTEFAKDALLKGVPPRLAPETMSLGKILPDDGSLLQDLKKAHSGDLLFWRVGQPDASYHFEKASKRERQVRAELEGILQAVREVVENLPNTVTLRVIVTSDHGRLLNPKSLRCLPIPEGMQAHGRVAWGKLAYEFDESGFAINETAGIIAIHGERFEMAHNMLLAWGEESFQNVKAGYEPYPHGGLFPEEAIVPWFVFVRDAQRPNLAISVHGAGEAENVGSLTVTIQNPSRIALECISISFSHIPNAKVEGIWAITPLDKKEFTLSIAPWPTKTDLPKLIAILLFRQPNGATFTVEVAPSLEIIALYERDDSLLKDLEL